MCKNKDEPVLRIPIAPGTYSRDEIQNLLDKSLINYKQMSIPEKVQYEKESTLSFDPIANEAFKERCRGPMEDADKVLESLEKLGVVHEERLGVRTKSLTGHMFLEGASALDKQVGGGHYKDMKIQPVEFIVANNIPYREANAIKYACRHRTKNGKEDVKKAIHYLEMVLEDYI